MYVTRKVHECGGGREEHLAKLNSGHQPTNKITVAYRRKEIKQIPERQIRGSVQLQFTGEIGLSNKEK